MIEAAVRVQVLAVATFGPPLRRSSMPVTRRWLAARGLVAGRVAALGGAGALLAACSAPAGGGADVAAGVAGPDGIVRLQKMAWGSALEKEAIEKGIELFHSQQPKVRVEYLHQPDAYDDKLQALIAAGTAPDVFKVGGALYADYIVVGALLDITDRI